MRDTRSYNARRDSRRRTLSSPQNTRASAASRLRRRLSAKFSRASGKNRAPGMRSPSTSVVAPFSPRTSQKSHSRFQKASRSSIDQRCSAA